MAHEPSITDRMRRVRMGNAAAARHVFDPIAHRLIAPARRQLGQMLAEGRQAS